MYNLVWYLLAAAAVLCLGMIWVWQAVGASGKWRRAQAERDAALGELAKLRGELDSLYDTHVKLRESLASAEALPAKVPEVEENRIEQLESGLDCIRAEFQKLHSLQERGLGEISASSQEITALQDRIGTLEEKLDTINARVHGVHSPEDGNARRSANPGLQEWRTEYLAMRTAALEEKLLRAGPPNAEPLSTTPDRHTGEQLARLRWRNRYLEERLAHFEEATLSESQRLDGKQAAAEVFLPAREAEVSSWKDVLEPDSAPMSDTLDRLHPSEAFLRVLDVIDDTAEALEPRGNSG